MAHNGRELKFDWDTDTLAGVQSRTLSFSNNYVDVTNDDSNAWRTLLADPGTRSVEVSISGVTENEILIADITAANVAAAVLEATLPTDLAVAGNVSGNWLISALELGGDHDGEYTFSVTFMSTGPVTYTASAVA